MGDQPVQHPAVEIHKNSGRQLRGARLWLARTAYFVTVLLVLIFFFVGLPAYQKFLDTGDIGMMVMQDTGGNLIVSSVAAAGDADGAGIQKGDEILSINGISKPSVEQANTLISGKIGDPVTINVRTGSLTARSVDLKISGRASQLLAQMHFSFRFLGVYNLVISCLLGAGIFLTSLLVFFRRSNDWLVILVAFSMLTFGAFLTTPVGYGTYKLHVLVIHNLIYMFGMVSMIVVYFLFPSGHFEPRWTRWVSILIFIPVMLDLWNLMTVNNYLVDFILWIGFFALGAYAQLYRYWKVATPTERQQTKQVVFGAVACFSIIAFLDLASIVLAPFLTYIQNLLFTFLIVKAGATIPVLVLDICFVLAIYRYRLWDTDLYINRTLVYSLVTLFLMLVWTLTTQVLNHASQSLFGKQVSWLGALLSSLQVAVIYKPVRKWVEKSINDRFYKDRIDYSEALVELQPEMWTYLTPVDLGHILVTKVPMLLQSTNAALFMQERQGPNLTEVHNIHPAEAYKLQFTPETMKKMDNATVLSLPEGGPFSILVPLTVARLKVYDLVGVLAIGPRTQGRGYSRDHLNDLSALGRSAGKALYMLKMHEKKQAREIPSRVEG
jgi:hypothetical protein